MNYGYKRNIFKIIININLFKQSKHYVNIAAVIQMIIMTTKSYYI